MKTCSPLGNNIHVSVWFVEIIAMQIEILGPCGCSSVFHIALRCAAQLFELADQLHSFVDAFSYWFNFIHYAMQHSGLDSMT